MGSYKGTDINYATAFLVLRDQLSKFHLKSMEHNTQIQIT